MFYRGQSRCGQSRYSKQIIHSEGLVMERRFLATRFDYDVVRGHMMTWGKAVDLATIAQHKEVEKIRALYLTDKTAYEDAKKQLPAFCVSSTYPSRKRGLKPMGKGRT